LFDSFSYMSYENPQTSLTPCIFVSVVASLSFSPPPTATPVSATPASPRAPRLVLHWLRVKWRSRGLKEHGHPHHVAIPRRKLPHDTTAGGDHHPVVALPLRRDLGPATLSDRCVALRGCRHRGPWHASASGGPLAGTPSRYPRAWWPRWAHAARAPVSLGHQGRSSPLGGLLWPFSLVGTTGRRTIGALTSGRIWPSIR
jgi:hypothetical protein